MRPPPSAFVSLYCYPRALLHVLLRGDGHFCTHIRRLPLVPLLFLAFTAEVADDCMIRLRLLTLRGLWLGLTILIASLNEVRSTSIHP